MRPLHPTELYSLEQYHKLRPEFRARVLAHKMHRHVELGPLVSLYFEDRLTIQYQIQEMLRIERIFEAEAVAEELDAYNPLIPGGMNLKATTMIEVPDVEERRRVLAELVGIEHLIYAEVSGAGSARAIADEDLERSDAEKTSAVHFLRFEFNAAMIDAFRGGASLTLAVDHPRYAHHVRLSDAVCASLREDFS